MCAFLKALHNIGFDYLRAQSAYAPSSVPIPLEFLQAWSTRREQIHEYDLNLTLWVAFSPFGQQFTGVLNQAVSRLSLFCHPHPPSAMASSSTTPSSSSLGSSRSSFAASSSSSLAGSPSPSSNSGSQPPCTSPQGCPTGAPPPATLYLYTFLSTLIILLLVSGGIIARSVVLRRRQQIAIANGTWIPPQRRENYSNRPRPLMFDAYLAMSAHGSKAKNDDEERWSCMKPFSASDISSPVKPIVVLPPVESVHDLHAPHTPRCSRPDAESHALTQSFPPAASTAPASASPDRARTPAHYDSLPHRKGARCASRSNALARSAASRRRG
ncbi:hypothetical protein MSAN_02207100 [Mycena sanguinolenta]|uniref:Uncharacterized protein n=1 Tax=Mycena sanguinolenta TaxID=230812 RepID=A0A8H6XE25_9AGAR|nr:hypothetical protein MSAN_02207100 [Mycena sanguinolenta]